MEEVESDQPFDAVTTRTILGRLDCDGLLEAAKDLGVEGLTLSPRTKSCSRGSITSSSILV